MGWETLNFLNISQQASLILLNILVYSYFTANLSQMQASSNEIDFALQMECI